MMKDIREVLFEQYSDEIENTSPTKMDTALMDVLGELENNDTQLFLKMMDAVTEVINEQMKMAYMAGFTPGTGACLMAYAVAI